MTESEKAFFEKVSSKYGEKIYNALECIKDNSYVLKCDLFIKTASGYPINDTIQFYLGQDAVADMAKGIITGLCKLDVTPDLIWAAFPTKENCDKLVEYIILNKRQFVQHVLRTSTQTDIFSYLSKEEEEEMVITFIAEKIAI